MILAIEIRFVDGECVDELFDLTLCIGAQPREIARERRRSGCLHPIEHAPLDVVAFGFRERHPGSSIEEFAKSAKFILSKRRNLRHVRVVSGADRSPSLSKTPEKASRQNDQRNAREPV